MNDLFQSKIPTIARIFLGLVFFVFGLNGFLGFIPQPPLPSEGAALMGAFAATGYMFPLIKGTEVLAGLLLLSGRFVPLALVLLAPIVVNIFLFHVVLAPVNMIVAVTVVLLEAYLGWAYRDSFAKVLKASAKPTVSEPQTTLHTSSVHA